MAGATKYWFAWVGGLASPAFTLQTTGDTWGGSLECWGDVWGGQWETTGDITELDAVIRNIAHTEPLIVGNVYFVTGPGIPTDALGHPFAQATYTGGDTITLSVAPTASQGGAQLVFHNDAQRTIVSDLVGTAQLVNGLSYAISGSGIQAGTTATWNGGTSITLSQPATDTAFASAITFGSPTDASLVNNLGSTSGLVDGQVYQVVGAGIPANTYTTYHASDGNKITLTRNATKTQQAAYLTIRKGMTEDDGGAFDPVAHAVEDEQVFALEIQQQEGDFATARVDIRNPRLGLVAPSRKWWVWLSWDDGSGTPVPLFHGRIVGVPQNLEEEVVTLEFVARPSDYDAQKGQLAATLEVAPYWDPIWLQNGFGDPDSALEARTALWHIDRTSLAVTISDYLQAEDGTIAIDESAHFYEATRLSYSGAPLVSVSVSASLGWTQTGEGNVDLTDQIVSAFKQAGSPFDWPIIGSFTGDGLLSAWPQPNASIGGGWSMSTNAGAIAADWLPVGKVELRYPAKGGTVSKSVLPASVQQNPAFIPPGNFSLSQFEGSEIGLKTMWANVTNWDVTFVYQPIAIEFVVHYRAARKRNETLFFTVNADVQTLLVDPGGSEAALVELNSSYADQPVDPGGAVPVGDLRQSSFFPTDRGQQSLQYLLALARARLVKAARAVDITFEMPWSATSVGVTCRKAVQLTDRRLPGGTATGKIKSYALRAAGDGPSVVQVTISCAIGHGNALAAAAPGTNTYADNYADGYTETVGGQVDVIAGELQYSALDGTYVVDNDGIDLFNMVPKKVVSSLRVYNGPNDQIAAAMTGARLYGDPIGGITGAPTQVDLKLVPVEGGDFLTQYPVNVSPLVVPKMIDLEAT